MNILSRSKSILMLLYKCFVFTSHGLDESHGSECRARFFRATLGVASVFVHATRMGSLEMHPQHTSGFSLDVNLDYQDFSGGIFDL